MNPTTNNRTQSGRFAGRARLAAWTVLFAFWAQASPGDSAGPTASADSAATSTLAAAPAQWANLILTIGRFGEPGAYPAAGRLRQALQLAADLGVQEQTTVFLDGIQAAQLAAEAPDIVPFINQNAFLLGYHGEASHGPFPVPELFDPLPGEAFDEAAAPFLLDGASWTAGIEACRTRYMHAFTSATLDSEGRLPPRRFSPTDASLPGGLQSVQRLMGRDLACLPAIGLAAPQFFEAMDGLTAAAAVAGAAPQACEYALGAPERPRPFEWRLEEPLFWHMNRLVMPIEVDSALLQLAPAADRVRQRFAAMDRSVPRILWFDLLNGRPLEETRQALEYLMDQAAEAKAKLRLSSPVDLLRHASAARRLASSAEALALADEILRGAQNRLPDYIRAGQRYFSLAETFQALADGLAFYRERQVLPASIEIAGALGPVGEKTELAPSEAFQALGSEILAAAEAAAAQMAQSRPARPPATLRLGEHRVNAAQFLVAMAWTWRWAASGREIEKAQVPVNAISMATALGDRLEERLKPGSENPAWFAKMQLWSLRPCPLPD